MMSVRTAGMVQGTPDWQLDLRVETTAADEWARQNSTRRDFDLRPCHSSLKMALSCVRNATNYLAAAADKVNGSPLDSEIMTLLGRLEEIEVDLRREERKVGKWT